MAEDGIIYLLLYMAEPLWGDRRQEIAFHFFASFLWLHRRKFWPLCSGQVGRNGRPFVGWKSDKAVTGPRAEPHGETSGRKQWNEQVATSSFLERKVHESLATQRIEALEAVGKDEVSRLNLHSSTRKSYNSKVRDHEPQKRRGNHKKCLHFTARWKWDKCISRISKKFRINLSVEVRVMTHLRSCKSFPYFFPYWDKLR